MVQNRKFFKGTVNPMFNQEAPVWVVRAGSRGEADDLFLKKDCVALGWVEMRDLSKIPGDREAFRTAYISSYPNAKPGAIPNGSGQIFRFVHELKEGDLVVYPSKIDRKVHLGRIAGPYRYDPTGLAGYPHRRSVKWLGEAPRTNFSQGALFEIGGALSFFQVKNYPDEFRSVLTGNPQPVPVAQDESIAQVAQVTEDSTRDFIIKRLAQELKGTPFEEFVAQLLETMGYRTKLQPEGKNGGVDILAYKDELGFQPPIIKVQVKSMEAGDVGDPAVAALFGRLSAEEFGLVVTLGGFTSKAVQFARGKSKLRLINGDDLVDLILEHYEDFDSRYKGLLPLKRVYVPELLDGEQG